MLKNVALQMPQYVDPVRGQGQGKRTSLDCCAWSVSLVCLPKYADPEMLYREFPVQLLLHPRDLNMLFVAYGGRSYVEQL